MKIKIVALLIFFYLASLLITLPADKVVRWLPEEAGIEVASASGSLWDGKVSKLIYQQNIQLQQLEWKVDWLALAHLQLKLNLNFNHGRAMAGKGSVLLGFTGISVEDFTVDITAPTLLHYANLSIPADIEGNISLVVKNGSQGEPYCQQIDGYIFWKNAQIESEIGTVDLDSAYIDLSCDSNGQLVVALQQQSEQLTSTANLILKEAGAYQLQGVLKPEKHLPTEFKNALARFGSKNPAGETVFNFNGKL